MNKFRIIQISLWKFNKLAWWGQKNMIFRKCRFIYRILWIFWLWERKFSKLKKERQKYYFLLFFFSQAQNNGGIWLLTSRKYVKYIVRKLVFMRTMQLNIWEEKEIKMLYLIILFVCFLFFCKESYEPPKTWKSTKWVLNLLLLLLTFETLVEYKINIGINI